MKTKAKKKNINSNNYIFYKIDQESVDYKDLSKEIIKANQNNQLISNKKENISKKDSIKKLYYLSNLKIRKNIIVLQPNMKIL